jgi:hypothetical protein
VQWLHITIIRSNPVDTIVVLGGQATFRYERETPDTVRMTFQLPPSN